MSKPSTIILSSYFANSGVDSNLVWKNPISNRGLSDIDALTLTFLNPVDGTTSSIIETGKIYRYSSVSSTWIDISSSHGFSGHEIIDAKTNCTLKLNRGLDADKPVTLEEGEPYFSLDTNALYIGNSAKNLIEIKDIYLQSTEPINKNKLWLDPILGTFYFYDFSDSTWKDIIHSKLGSSDITALLSQKADKATTLSGYAITDAYTKSEVNSSLDLKFDKTGGKISGAVELGSYLFRTTQDGTSYFMQQDGTGNLHWYWNTIGGTSPVFERSNTGASDIMQDITSNGLAYFKYRYSDGSTKSAGDSIKWTDILYADSNNVFKFLDKDVWHKGNLESAYTKAETDTLLLEKENKLPTPTSISLIQKSPEGVYSFAKYPKESFGIALSDEVTPLVAGSNKLIFRMPYAFNLLEIRASVSYESTSGNITLDIKHNGVSVTNSYVVIDAGSKTSLNSSSSFVITTTSLLDDSEITIDLVSAGTNSTGLKLWLIGRQL
jgi:hypothetical protein